jgi:predicted AlkP superfamily phosphohydrolase/phosphomutase
VFVVSDHGFGPLHYKFRANKWLAQQRLLTPSRRRGVLGRMIASADVLRLRHRVARLLMRGKTPGTIPFWRWMNWSRTRAYAASVTEMGIYVNLRGRESDGIVSPGAEYEEVREAILHGLRELKYPGTGRPVVTMAARREEVFDGSHMENAPDIVYVLDDGACTVDLRLEGPLFERASWRTGTGMHRFDGVFIAHGPRIRPRQHLPVAEIIDVAPAILQLFGIPIPAEVEGRVPEGLLAEQADRAGTRVARIRRRAGKGKPAAKDDVAKPAYSEEEARQVEQRLRDLGYL